MQIIQMYLDLSQCLLLVQNSERKQASGVYKVKEDNFYTVNEGK